MLRYFLAVLAARRGDDRGASGVEYGLLVAAVAAVITAVAFAVGAFVHDGFQKTCDELEANAQPTTTATCP